MSGPDAAAAPKNFNRVLAEELDALDPPVAGAEDCAQARRAALTDELFGVALSGGGIRSATFNLGVLQALARQGWLQRADYLSTVSGGGYIGGWLSAWIKRKGRGAVFDALSASAARSASQEQRAPIDHLRRFSNYLTPQVGAMSADFWTGVATYIRNLLLNQTIVVPLLLLALLAPWGVAMLAGWLLKDPHPLLLPGLAFGLLLPPAVIAGVNFADAAQDAGRPRAWEMEPAIAQMLLAMLPAAFCLALWLPVAWPVTGVLEGVPVVASALFGALAYFLLVAACGGAALLRWRSLAAARRARPQVVKAQQDVTPGSGPARTSGAASQKDVADGSKPAAIVSLLLWSLLAGAAGGAMLAAAHALLSVPFFAGGGWLLPGLGSVVVLFALAQTVVFHIGLVGRGFSEAAREWLGRAAAWLFIYAVLWTALFAFAFLSPAVLFGGFQWASGAGGLAWAGTTIAGVVFGSGERTGRSATSPVRDLIARIAPYVYVLGLLGALASALYLFVVAAAGGPGVADMLHSCNGSLSDCVAGVSAVLPRVHGVATAWFALGCAVVVVLMGWRIDVNLFSFHGYYRNRISRAYLGASHRPRRPQPFTGFDEEDDLMLHTLVADGAVQRPLHIVNTTLNLTRGNELAWQERKGASFAITPLHCGYDLSTRGTDPTYLDTAAHRSTGLHLSTAIAASGAAASPNMGYHTSLPVAFLMTLFNVRLGWWMPNTACPDAWRATAPMFGVGYIVKELFASVDEKSRYVYLSDGGHFDNMGLYELVRRRCRYIIVSDAEADGDFLVEGIGAAIRKCRIDFDVDIELDIAAIKPERRRRDTGATAVVGTIRYPGAAPGLLLYLKSSLLNLEALPPDVRNYAYQHAQFPHEPTSDQWFDESQFESYRRLGYVIANLALGGDDAAGKLYAGPASGQPWLSSAFAALKEASDLALGAKHDGKVATPAAAQPAKPPAPA